MRSTKIDFYIFVETCVRFFVSFTLIKNFKPESYCFERNYRIWCLNFFFFFFYQGFLSQTLTTHRTAGEGRGPSFIPLYQFHPLTNIYLQLCMWDDYHIFLIAPLVFTRLLLDENCHLIELPFDWLMMWH